MENIQNSLQFKLLFFSKSISNCLQKSKTVDECTQEAAKGIKEVIENTRKSLDKLWDYS